MGAPEVLREQAQTPFASHEFPDVLREHVRGLSNRSFKKSVS